MPSRGRRHLLLEQVIGPARGQEPCASRRPAVRLHVNQFIVFGPPLGSGSATDRNVITGVAIARNRPRPRGVPR